jgi:hypothetical protein
VSIATIFVEAMKADGAWNTSAQHTAKKIDPEFRYDRMENDLAFYYFTDGSKAGVRPMSHQAWEAA